MKQICETCPRFLRLMRACPQSTLLASVAPLNLAANAVFGLASISAELLLLWLVLQLSLQRNFRNWAVFLLYCGAQFVALVAKELVRHPRPLESCNPGFGLPSNHVCAVAAVATFALLERTPVPQSPASQPRLPRGRAAAWLLFLALLMLSRVQLKYHSTAQVVAGAVLGAAIALLYPLALRLLRVERVLAHCGLLERLKAG